MSLMFLPLLAAAQTTPADIAGRWIVNDPDSHQPTAIIEIRTAHGGGGGTLVEPFDTPRDDRCTHCEGTLKNALMWGLPLLDQLQIEDDGWHGRILDPDSGRYYHLHLEAQGNELHITVRALFGLVRHHETWQRAQR